MTMRDSQYVNLLRMRAMVDIDLSGRDKARVIVATTALKHLRCRKYEEAAKRKTGRR